MTRTPVRLRFLLILLTAIGFLPVTLIGAWGVKTAADAQRRELERSMLDLTRALSSAVDAELDGWVGTLRSMAHAPVMANGDLPGFYTLAREQVRLQPEWTGIVLSDAAGKPLFKTELPYGEQDLRTFDPDSVVLALATGGPVVGRIGVRQGGQLAFPIRVPVMDQHNKQYVLSALIKPDRVLTVVNRQQIPDGWVISIFDRTGLRVARSRDQAATVATGPSPTLARLLAGPVPEGIGITHTLEGSEVLTSYTRISHFGWTVAVGAPMLDLRQAWLHSAGLYVLGVAASLALCVLLAWLIGRRTVRAMADLQEQAARLGRGEPVAPPPSGIYELQQVGLALQDAAQQRLNFEQERERLMASLEMAMQRQDNALAKASNASLAKDTFLAVLGHELRNPLSPIVTALDLMDAREQGSYRREREVMRRQVNHLKRLVDDLLDVSRITRGKLELRRHVVDLAQVVNQAVETVRASQTPAPRIAVSGLDELWLRGDESRLVQVITNLLSNAVRFGGERDITLELTVDAGMARIVVTDQGVGMSQEMLEHIFEPFYQAPQPLARANGGLGLGLSIVRSIVELHGGRMEATSAGQGCGTRIVVQLPVDEAAECTTPK